MSHVKKNQRLEWLTKRYLLLEFSLFAVFLAPFFAIAMLFLADDPLTAAVVAAVVWPSGLWFFLRILSRGMWKVPESRWKGNPKAVRAERVLACVFFPLLAPLLLFLDVIAKYIVCRFYTGESPIPLSFLSCALPGQESEVGIDS